MATGPWITFATKLAQMITAAEEEINGAVNVTFDKHVNFQDHLCHVKSEATTWSIVNMDHIVKLAGEKDLWYHFDRPDAVKKAILHLLFRVWHFVAGNWLLKTLENRRIVYNTLLVS